MPVKPTRHDKRKKSTGDTQADGPRAAAKESPARDSTRPLTVRGRATVTRILASAIDIFVTEGYGGMSMRQVATSAGLALSNLQHYFPTREQLFEAIVDATLAEYSTAYDQIRNDATLSPAAQLEKVARLVIEDGLQPKTQGLFVNLWALALTQEFARKRVEEAYTFQRSMIARFITAVNPNFSKIELAHRAALITSQLEGLLLLVPQRNRFPSDLKGIEDAAVKAIMALATRPW